MLDAKTIKLIDESIPKMETLGVNYSSSASIFRLWAPLKEKVELVLDDSALEMKKDNGVFELEVKGDLKNHHYHYLVEGEKILDPFGYVKDYNETIIVDIDEFKREKISLNKCICPIIYETSVRDFSSIKEPFKYPKKFKALIEDNLKIDGKSIGLAYLKELGITHLELLPILDFDNDNSEYNWGYNPLAYNYFYDEYFMAHNEKRIIELQEVIDTLHKNNLRVILDVVFNHVYKKELFALSKLCDDYFFREKESTGLGNEVKTEAKFMREYLTLMCQRLVEIYDVDGFRFDLSAYIDKTTALNIKDECLKIKNDLIFIGEGWEKGDNLEKDDKCSIDNHLNLKGYYFFNGEYREYLTGFNGDGFLMGNHQNKLKVMDGINAGLILDEKSSLNYLECHDGLTFIDYLNKYYPNDDNNSLIAKLGLSMILFSKGLSFIHSGQEFLRTKKGNENSYNQSDEINKLDWYLRVKNEKMVDDIKELIKFKKELSHLDNQYQLDHYYELIVISVGEYKILINASVFDHIYNDEHEYEVIYNDGKVNYFDKAVNIKHYSMAIIRRVD